MENELHGQERSIEELKSLCVELQQKVDLSSVIKLALSDAKASLDAELALFKVMESYSENALATENKADFITLSLEAYIEAFETECCLIFSFNEKNQTMEVIGEFGLGESVPDALPWLPNAPNHQVASLHDENSELLQAWSHLNFHHAMVCTYTNRDGHLTGCIVMGVLKGSEEIFQPLNAEHISSFTTMVHLTGAIWNNRILYVELKERNAELAKFAEAFSHFVPHEFLRLLNKESAIDLELVDHNELVMSILFADIRSFTTLSEGMTPGESFHFINSYLFEMEPLIKAQKGFIDKYIGDAIMALFPETADDAVKAALSMLIKLREFNEMVKTKRTLPQPIQIGVGLHTGMLMLGIVGGAGRMEGTVISDAVNIASR